MQSHAKSKQDQASQANDEVDLVAKLKTANQIGVKIPPSVLARAEKIIQMTATSVP